MVSETFKENFIYGNDNEEETNNIILKHLDLLHDFGIFEIMNSKPIDDMTKGIDLNVKWNLSIAKRRRKYAYKTFASERMGGSFTLRLSGEKGGRSEIYKMIHSEYKAEIYLFIWDCGSYALIDIKKWIESGGIKQKLKEDNIKKNINRYNTFLTFTLSDLEKNDCIIYFHRE